MISKRSDFPVLTNNPDIAYLDSAATSQKPKIVIEAVQEFCLNDLAAVHRGLYPLAESATAQYESVRRKIAEFIGARESSEIIFTSGATASINLVSHAWAESHLGKDDIIVLSSMEHHSNLVPWQEVARKTGAELRYLPLTEDYRVDFKGILSDVKVERVKLVAITHVSNVLGVINPLSGIKDLFPCAKILVDAAQSISHVPLNVRALDVDFAVFSSHKMFGPSGVGVLYAKDSLLRSMRPFITGGHMVLSVNEANANWADIPSRFEAGTPNIEGVIGLGAAIKYMETLGYEYIAAQEKTLTKYLIDQLRNINVDIIGPSSLKDRVGVVSFQIPGAHPHDVADILGRNDVAVRAGHHCAQPLMKVLGLTGTVRASIHIYNNRDDIDALVCGISEVRRVLGL